MALPFSTVVRANIDNALVRSSFSMPTYADFSICVYSIFVRLPFTKPATSLNKNLSVYRESLFVWKSLDLYATGCLNAWYADCDTAQPGGAYVLEPLTDLVGLLEINLIYN